MFKLPLGVFFGVAILGMTSTAQATIILNNNFEITGTQLFGTIDGMFSGDAGMDGVLDLGEVDTFMATYTGSGGGGIADFTLALPLDDLTVFKYDPAGDVFLLTISDDMTLAKLFYDSFDNDGAITDLIGNSLGSDSIHSITAKVPEPSTMLLFGVGLIGLIGIGRWRGS